MEQPDNLPVPSPSVARPGVGQSTRLMAFRPSLEVVSRFLGFGNLSCPLLQSSSELGLVMGGIAVTVLYWVKDKNFTLGENMATLSKQA